MWLKLALRQYKVVTSLCPNKICLATSQGIDRHFFSFEITAIQLFLRLINKRGSTSYVLSLALYRNVETSS